MDDCGTHHMKWSCCLAKALTVSCDTGSYGLGRSVLKLCRITEASGSKALMRFVQPNAALR
eukprot:scaffold117850_cov45-Prasinocladus_malaysianus.AAC.1